MLFKYKAIDVTGARSEGEIDALNVDIAISALQRRGLSVAGIHFAESGASLLTKSFSIFGKVKIRDVVLLSRQMATLFEAQVSAVRIFNLLASEAGNVALRDILLAVAEDIQSGSAISKAIAKHPSAFSDFYVNMVSAGEESGKLNETFLFLADYLERSYEITSKARNAMIYPTFVIFTFIAVMALMLTTVIPNLSGILRESGQEIPIYTKVVLGISDFFVNYGIFILIVVIIAVFGIWRWGRTEGGRLTLDRVKLSTPYLGNLYKKLYLSRVADNMQTMLLSAIPIVRTLEVTASVVGSAVYERIFKDATEDVRSGKAISDALGKNSEVPQILVQMIKVGEESGSLGEILKMLARFYRREVFNAVDTLVGLIEPIMIVALGLGVGFLLAAVLIPIYNIAAAQ